MTFASTAEELERQIGEVPDLVLMDLTTRGQDYDALFATLESRTPHLPVLGFTTHALARQTQPLHPRCDRVVTRETLTQELGRILTDGIATDERAGRSSGSS